MSNEEWGNLGDFDATDTRAAVVASNKARANNPEYKKRCSQAQYKRYKKPGAIEVMREVRQKEINTPFGVFKGAKLFDEWAVQNITPKFGVKIFAGDKIDQLPHLYFYTEDGPGEVKYESVVYTPYGCASRKSGTKGTASLKLLLERAKEAGDPDANNKFAIDWIKKMKSRDPENYYEKEEPKREWLLDNNK